MSGDGSSDNGNRTVFRPSPLAGIRLGQGGPASPSLPNSPPNSPAPPALGSVAGWGALPPAAPPPAPSYAPPPASADFTAPPPAYVPQSAYNAAPQKLNDDDIPIPRLPNAARAPLVTEAGPVLALAASLRSGRAAIAMPDFHREASQLIANYDRIITPLYPEETRQRARYALCATVDDIAQNLPSVGQDGAEWARRSMVVQFFRENIGGDRFWQLVDDVLARPAQNAELIELFAACLAAGFEGRFRVMPDGRGRLQQIFSNLHGALEHPRAQSTLEISPQWHGADAPLTKIGLWNRVTLAAAAMAALLLLIYIILRLLLMVSGEDSWKAVRALSPDESLRLSRVGTQAPPPPASPQLDTLQVFLKAEIDQKLVVVEEDASTVRVRTTMGQLFKPGSDQLETGFAQLFERIGRAVEGQPGEVTIEGHSDSDQIHSLAFPDNMALSQARANTVSSIITSVLSNPGRISVQGFGDTRPIGANDSDDGKALNRRVEIVIPRHN